MKAPSFAYARPQSLDEALALLGKHRDAARVLAGGQSLIPSLNMRLSSPELLVDINGLTELGGIRVQGDVLRIGALALDGKKFDYKTNERLHRALELKLFEDQKDTIKLTSLVSKVMDAETQEKIDVVKSRLIKNMGYCNVCATDVLNYVASIFARGDKAN